MSEIEEIACPRCHQTFFENQLRMKQTTVESCPSCGETIRVSDRWGSTNVEISTMSDIQAIDTWLDNHATATSKKVVKRDVPPDKKQTLWAIETGYPFPCEICYQAKAPNFVAVRFISTEKADVVLNEQRRLFEICARHGLSAYGTRHTTSDELGVTVSAVWGAQQHLSTYTLSEAWFDPLFQRLNSAMKEVLADF